MLWCCLRLWGTIFVDIFPQKEYNFYIIFLTKNLKKCDVNYRIFRMVEEQPNIKQVVEMWYLNPRTISDVCSNGKFDGATEFDYDLMIPKAVG